MKPICAYLTTGLAVSLLLAACSPSATAPPLVPTRQTQANLSGSAPVNKPSDHTWKPVSFKVNLPTGFRTQGVAEASFAKLEIFNKYNVAAYNVRGDGTNPYYPPGDHRYDGRYLEPSQAIHATNADENGFVPVSGSVILLGTEVPPGPNWLVKIKLYSNNNEDSLIQELSAGFSLPLENTDPVEVNAQTHLVGWVLNTLQGLNLIRDGVKLLDTPLDFTALQYFMNGLMGLPETLADDAEFPTAENPENHNPELRTIISTDPIAYPRLEALAPQPACIPSQADSNRCIPQVRPPSVALSHLDQFALAQAIADKLYAQEPINYTTGAALWDADAFRRPGYLASHLKLQQRDSVGSAMALNGNRLFMINSAVFNDAQETVHGLHINDSGDVSIGFAIKPSSTTRIDSRFPALGQIYDQTTPQDVIYMMQTTPAAPGIPTNSNPTGYSGDSKLVAIRQDTGAVAWEFTDWGNGLIGTNLPSDWRSRNTAFTPVVQKREGQSDVVYTILDPLSYGTNKCTRGVYKIEAGTSTLGTRATHFYCHESSKIATFTSSGALSADGSKLYLLTKRNSSSPSQLIILNTSDMSLANDPTEFQLATNERYFERSVPIIGRDGRVYAVSYTSSSSTSQGFINAFNSEGELEWRYALPQIADDTFGQTHFAPILYNPPGEDPMLFLSNRQGTVYAVKDTGAGAELMWQHATPSELFESPSLIENEDGSVELYIGSGTSQGRIRALDPISGEQKWDIFPGGFFSTGFIVKNGFAYITTRSGNYGDFTYFRSIRVAGKQNAPTDLSTWPKPGGSLQNTGRAQLNSP